MFPGEIPAFTRAVIPEIVVLLGMGICQLLAVLLLWRRQRIGWILAAILFVIEVLSNSYIVLHGTQNAPVPQYDPIYILGSLLGLVGLIYVLGPALRVHGGKAI
jgi:hypothetical protein